MMLHDPYAVLIIFGCLIKATVSTVHAELSNHFLSSSGSIVRTSIYMLYFHKALKLLCFMEFLCFSFLEPHWINHSFWINVKVLDLSICFMVHVAARYSATRFSMSWSGAILHRRSSVWMDAIVPQVAVCSIIYPRRNHDINPKLYDFFLFMKMKSLPDCPPCTPINFWEFWGLYITVIGVQQLGVYEWNIEDHIFISLYSLKLSLIETLRKNKSEIPV